ncbi:uncharacterized protein LOC143917851 [Arctopsyche grandis]|uniref:uncharacterized protein LOC143917851 n=1 Tax=Arctopsyche grandis TaxID=121162 RepID=UPI00406D682B
MAATTVSAATRSSQKLGEILVVQTTLTPPLDLPTNANKRPTIIIYPTVSPESVIVPIVSSILGFPLLALLVICCLRRRAKMARERDRRRNCGVTSTGLSLVRLGAGRVARTPSIARSARDRPSLDLATVLEERSDLEQTQTELMTPDREERMQLSRLLSQPARYFLEGGR